ncbi:hypothetical protein FOBRF1_003097 [Fusarium oxysporum]
MLARQTYFNIPSQPVVFTKPADLIAAPFDDIHVHAEAQSHLDYEGELYFIFGKDCKDVTESDAMDCVLGYTIGNDLSARNYIPQEISGFQMSYGKSFDAFAPFGPYIVHPRIVGDPHQLQLTTKDTDFRPWFLIRATFKMEKTLEGKVALVTGSSRGI